MPRHGGFRPTPSRDKDCDWEGERNGATRCTATVKHGERKGERCAKYAVLGQNRCRSHGAKKSVAKRSRYRFKSKALQAVMDSNLAEEDFLSTRDELALMRTLVVSAVARMTKDCDDIADLSLDKIDLLERWTASAGKLAEITNRIERGLRMHVTVDSFVQTLADLCEIIQDVCPAEMAETLINRIENISTPLGVDQSEPETET